MKTVATVKTVEVLNVTKTLENLNVSMAELIETLKTSTLAKQLWNKTKTMLNQISEIIPADAKIDEINDFMNMSWEEVVTQMYIYEEMGKEVYGEEAYQKLLDIGYIFYNDGIRKYHVSMEEINTLTIELIDIIFNMYSKQIEKLKEA